MRIARPLVSILTGILLSTAALASPPARARVVRRTAASGTSSGAMSPQAALDFPYSTEVPLVAHITPTAATDTLVLSALHPFTVTLSARDPRTGAIGAGVAIPQNDIFGFFSIPTLTFNASNPEVFIKIIDGRAFNNAYWVFYNGLTDLEYTLTVTEVSTGRVKAYLKHSGNTECGAQDTSAFPVTSGSSAEPADALPLDLDAIAPTARATTLRTSIDISNTTGKNGVTADFQYGYTCISDACNPVGAFYLTATPDGCKPGQCITLKAFDSFHVDDIVSYLASFPGVLQPGADKGSYGTLLVTFRNLDSNVGFEGTVQARTYSRVVEVDPLKGTVGVSTPPSLFYEASKTTLVGTARDTRGGGGDTVGTLSSNVGIRNSDVLSTGQPVTVDLTFYDIATGSLVGHTVTLSGLRPGEMRETSDIWTAAGIDPSVHSVIVFADIRGATSNSASIEGYITIDDVNSKDSAFVELKCYGVGVCPIF